MLRIYPSMEGRLKDQHLTIAEIIRSVPYDRLTIRPAPGKWNIHDNLAHLVQYQIVFKDRVDQILTKDVPCFERYKAENDPGFESFRQQSDEALLRCLAQERKELYEFITNIRAVDLARAGIHRKYGRLNLIQWTEFFLLHEAHHIFTIFQLVNDTDMKS